MKTGRPLRCSVPLNVGPGFGGEELSRKLSEEPRWWVRKTKQWPEKREMVAAAKAFSAGASHKASLEDSLLGIKSP